MKYGQFCPIAKATELLGERWTFLIVRELLSGCRRFTQLQRGLGDISPALLTARLKAFEEAGLIVRRRIEGGRGYEYLPTPASEALKPVIVALGEWGLVWARHRLMQEDFDVDFLMHHLELSVDPAAARERDRHPVQVRRPTRATRLVAAGRARLRRHLHHAARQGRRRIRDDERADDA